MPQEQARVIDVRWGTVSHTSQPNIQAEISSGFHTTKAQRGLKEGVSTELPPSVWLAV